MKSRRVIHTAAALFLAAGLVGAFGPGTAQAQGRGRGDPRHEEKDKDKDKDKDQRPVPQQEQQRRLEEQRRRDIEYQQMLNNQLRISQEQAARLQQEKRAAQYAAQQQYLANLRQQQQRLQTTRNYDRDPHFTAPVRYRYRAGGYYHETTQYGADVLRQAVNYGYQQGYQAGRADRQDRWPANYSKSYAYQDANYGYTGAYVPQTDYNLYFREGFRRGYDDGYTTRSQYGTVANGSPSILSNILSAILGFTSVP
jgi:hypothetical protein